MSETVWVNGKAWFSRCFQLSEDIHHPRLRDHHGDRHAEGGGTAKCPHVGVESETCLNTPPLPPPRFGVPCVAAGARQNAAGVVPGGPSVPRPALFAHGDHPDLRAGGAQRGAPL